MKQARIFALLTLAALAGCGRATALSSTPLTAGTVASKAVLAQRLVVGFGTLPDAQAFASQQGVKVIKQYPQLAMLVVETARPVAQARQALLAVPGVQFVESELLPPLELPKGTPVVSVPTQGRDVTDPMRKDQWALDTMGVPKVWDAAKDLKSVTVGLVDTGVDLTHPDLKANLVPGWNAEEPGKPPVDQAGHGTMTAGCIAAVANNGIGVAGVAPNAKVMPIKVGNSASSVVDAMMYAADHTDMISMSLSFKPNMEEYQTAVQTTRRAALYVMGKKVPMVCSMGNTGTASKNVPSYFAGSEVPGLIAVGATDKADHVTSFSTYGTWTTVCAPGAKILTTANGGGYDTVDGTSFSTPLTAGVVALMLGHGAPHDPAAIKKILQDTATDIEAPGRDDKAGSGRVDAFRAVMGAAGR